MTSPNRAIVQGIYAAFGRGDVGAALAAYAADAVVSQAASLPYGGQHRGRAAIERSITTLLATWEELRIPVDAFLASGEQVIVREQFFGRVPGSSVTLHMRMVEVFTLEAGRVVAVDVFYHDTAALVRALGAGGAA